MKQKINKTPFLYLLPIAILLNIFTGIQIILRNDYSAIIFPVLITSLVILTGLFMLDRYLSKRVEVKKMIIGELLIIGIGLVIFILL